MHIELDLVLVVLETAEDGQRVANAHIVVAEPHADLTLTLASRATVITVVIQPQDARHNTS